MKRVFMTSIALALSVVLYGGTASAQVAQVGQVVGEVVDASGGVLPGATVTLSSQERGFSRTSVTDSNGRYRFAQVPLGRYTVEVRLQGFQPRSIQNNLVEFEKETVVNVTMSVGGVAEVIEVVGSVPIVDPTNQTQQTRVRVEEFEKLPVGRNYQSLIGFAPGVVGTGNVNAQGSTNGNNIFLFDGVNTTDPTTGTFGSNLNFEAIQEVVVRTSAMSAEFGRGSGAIVDVITKAGTNRFEGSYKYLMTNDQWNKLEKTKSEVAPNASLTRTRFDKVNPVNNFTVGGPALKDRAWFFLSYDRSTNTSPQRQTNAAPGFTPEDFQQTTKSGFVSFRVSGQLAQNHNLWVKYTTSPTDGFVIDYHGTAAERFALTEQNQGARNWAMQYSGVFGNRWTGEFMAATAEEFIDVVPFSAGPLTGGAPYFDLNDGRYYNGGAFDGKVDRPRDQATAAVSYFATMGRSTHQLKGGVDWQGMTSSNDFKFPGAQLFMVNGFNPVTRTFAPSSRRDYDTGASSSKGNHFAFYVRDKIQIDRLNLELGLRVDRQSGTSDVGLDTVEATSVSPRFSGSYAVTRDARTIVVGSYGRLYDSILQGFSDSFAAVPQRTNYNNYTWDGTQYVFSSRFEVGASTFRPDTNVKPRYVDEFSIGVEHQVGNTMGFGTRFISRDWGNFIDDLQTFNADNSIRRVVVNYPAADRTYRGIEFTFDKRFSNRWSAIANYTYARTRANHWNTQGSDFTALGNFNDASCRQTTDLGLGDASGVIPCSVVEPNLMGKPSWDRPHNIKFGTTYLQPIGPVDVTLGVSGNAVSKTTYTRNRTLTVLRPGTLTSAGATLGYNYEPLGSNRIPGLQKTVDLSIEALYSPIRQARIGFKAEIFNIFDNQDKIGVNNTAWCNSNATAACATAITNFGTATTRGNFVTPMAYRFTVIARVRLD